MPLRWITSSDFKNLSDVTGRPYDEIKSICHRRNVVGYACHDSSGLIGYCVYSLYKRQIRLELFAYSKAKAYTEMLDKIESKIHPMPRHRQAIVVHFPFDAKEHIDFLVARGYKQYASVGERVVLRLLAWEKSSVNEVV